MDRRTFIPTSTSAPSGSPVFARIYHDFMTASDRLCSASGTVTAEEEDKLETAYGIHFHRMNAARPTTPLEFVQKFYALWNGGGAPAESTMEQIIAEAAAFIQESPS